MKKQKALLAALGMTCALTQTGCIAGIVTGNPALLWPGVAAGSLGAVAQLLSGGHPVSWFVMVAGIALDEQNPGRQESLNVLPIHQDVATRMGAQMVDLEVYNEELSDVLVTNNRIESIVRLMGSPSGNEATLEQSAREFGFANADELAQVVAGDQLSCQDLSRFAQAQGLSETTARIYLGTRFKIRTADGC